MENPILTESGTLHITSHCFQFLLDKILDHFKSKYSQTALSRVGQLYGFGNFDVNKPNLKKELEGLTTGFVNGKYLYDKSRELQAGRPIIKLNGFYKLVLFQYIGYKNIVDFTNNAIVDQEEKKRQLELISSPNDQTTYYYVGYHFGEYKEIVKAQVIVTNDWKNIEYTYLYPQSDGTFKKFLYYGTVRKRADILHVRTKTLLDGRMVDGGETILYIGYGDPGRCAFILGIFSAFDINNRVIGGKMIQEKCTTKEEMFLKSKDRKIPAYISQELRNIRIENEAIIPNNEIEISSKSPYSITYEKIPGNYQFRLNQDETILGDFSFSVDKNTFKISPSTSGVLINQDRFELIQNGSVIHFSFQITGIAVFSRLEIFFKTYYLNGVNKEIKGVFSGLDIENRLINGEVEVFYKPMNL